MIKLVPHISKKGFLLVARSSGIMLLSAALLVFMGIKINSVTTAIVKSHDQRTAFTAKFERFDILKKDAEAVAGVTTQMNAAIPTMDTMPTVVDYINTLGARTQTTVAVQFESNAHASGTGTLAEVGFAFQASGPLPSILDLFKKIENAPYLISIRSVNISLPDQETNQVAVQANGSVYIQTTPQ